jgi:hypothetical protein
VVEGLVAAVAVVAVVAMTAAVEWDLRCLLLLQLSKTKSRKKEPTVSFVVG